jgi:hypothetical protein
MTKSLPKNHVIKNDTVQCDITANVQQWLTCHMMKWCFTAMMMLCCVGMICCVYCVLYEPFIQNMSSGLSNNSHLFCGNSLNGIPQHIDFDLCLMKYNTIIILTEDNHEHLSKEENHIKPEFKPLYFSDYIFINHIFTPHYDIQVIKSKLVSLACQHNSLRKEEYRYCILHILNNYHNHLKICSATKDFRHKKLYGGGIMATWSFSEIEKYAMKPYHYSMDDVFVYGVHAHSSLLHEYTRGDLCWANVPLWLLS